MRKTFRVFNLSLLQGLLPLNPIQIPMEIIAGLSFAAIVITQGMGYTKIAGLPVITSVYTLLLPMVAFAIFGSSRHLVVGADSAIAVSWFWNLYSYGIVTLGELPAGLPTLSIPTIPPSDIPSIVSIAVTCFMVILAQSIVTSRAYSIKFADIFDENKDLIGIRLANIAAEITGTFVVNGSPTKTEEVRRAGGRTQFTQLVAVAVTVAFLFFSQNHLRTFQQQCSQAYFSLLD